MKPMKIENSTGVEFTAIIYSTSPTCNLISFPRFLSYRMVPTFLDVEIFQTGGESKNE